MKMSLEHNLQENTTILIYCLNAVSRQRGIFAGLSPLN